MRVALLLVGGAAALAGTACLREPAFDSCADGRVCASGQLCVEPRATCVPADLAAPCLGQAEAATCATPSITDGVCDRGLCVSAGCGNGVVEPARGELCDDGNTTAGDGCGFDCQSDERCGNGEVDALVGEQCDDGGLASRDGCSSRCRIESARWRGLLLSPGPRTGAAHTVDLARGRLVTFSGLDDTSVLTPETWEHDGHGWRRPIPTVTPQARQQAAMGYDLHRREVLLFGGMTGASTLLNDLWSWNGSAWSLITTLGAPPAPRRLASLSYDPVRRRVLLFGGLTDDAAAPDLWELDADRVWHRVQADDGPPVGFVGNAPLPAGYDPRAAVLLVVAPGRTFTWDGVRWGSVATTTAPLDGAPLVVDPSDGRLRGTAGTQVLAWNGASWSPQPDGLTVAGAALGYVERAGGLIAFDPAGQVTLVGSGVALGATPPTAAALAPMAADPLRGELVRFGGLSATTPYLDQLWIRRNGGWTQRLVTPRPPGRNGACMAFDPRSGEVILFGGTGPGGVLGDTWSWDGARWAAAAPVTAPSPRQQCVMVTHEVRRSAILLGGTTDGSTPEAEVWEWTGTWQRLGDLPVPLIAPGAFYDRVRQRLVVTGGQHQGGGLSDRTYAWDGATWVELSSVLFPSARYGVGVAFHASAGIGLLSGGAATTPISDSWAWDGSRWTPVSPVPAGRRFPSVGYDALGRELVLTGGLVSSTQPFNSTWSFGFEGTDPIEACDTGIDGDGDGLLACEDPDCWPLCTPTCAPGEACDPTMGPRCGDGVCSSLEGCRLCPADCGACEPGCGDGVCDPGEVCPGDCS